MYNDGRAPTMRDHTYWWQSGSHGVSLSDRQVVAVWLEAPAGSELPGTPRSVEAQARDGRASLEWVPPPEVPSKPVTSYEYQQEGTETWNSTGGTATTKEVAGLANGESYTFRVRAVNAAGKGAASAPSDAVTPAAPGLTAAFTSVPEAHDGSTAFGLQIEFSEDVAGRLRRMRNDIFEVTGGAVTDLRRVDRRRDLWTVTVTPSSDDAVTVAVPANRACDVSGAVCTADGEQLSSRAEATVPGPLPAVSVSAGTSPVTEGTAASFTFTRTGDMVAALTVTVSVSEDGAVLAGTPPTEAVFAAGAATVDFTVATEDDEVAGDGSVVTVTLVAGTGYAVDANASAATVTVEDDDAAAENAAPTGLPTIAGTARVGQTLTASAGGIADDDGLANATFAWQWIANDGTADADIAGATGTSYTLTATEVGKTVKVRVAFTDDGGTEETLVSGATAAVEAALPLILIEVVSSQVTEGEAASFRLSRTGDTASTLEVSVSVTQAGAVLSGTPASTVTFGAGSAEATLSAATDDDSVAEADGRVTASVVAGSGYSVDANASAATVDVYDNDEATTAAETLWTSTLTVESIGGVLFGTVGGGNALSPEGWSEDGAQFRVEQLYYFPEYAELAFAVSAAPPQLGQLTLHLDDVQVQLSGAQSERYFYWTVADPGWQAGQTVTVKLTRTDPDAVVVAGPGLSVADAQVREAEGALLSFRVTLDEAQASAVSVRYATSDGTATAGADYEAVSGALRFGPGETAKTVSVPVLNDTHDEGSETLTLALSAPFGAEVADGTATGTIVNTGPIPRAWITRFGRTVGLQAIEAIGDRLGGAGGTEVVVGGVGLSGPGAYAGTPLGEEADWPIGPEDEAWSPDGDNGKGMTGRELLLGSSFRLGAGGEDGAPSLTAWGRVASSGFDGEEAGLSLSGDVTTGFLGADMAHDSWLAGLAVGVSEGEGSFDDGTGDGRGTVESSLTSVYPYARFGLGDGVDIWGLVGVGSGDLKLTVGEEEFQTDLSMQMGALGLRGEVVPAEEEGDFGLAWKSDALWVRTESAASRSSTGGNLEAASGDVSRVRVALEGSRAFAAGPGHDRSDTHPDAGDRVAPRCRRCGDRDGRGGRRRASVRGPGSGPHRGRQCAGASGTLGRGLRGVGRVRLGPSRSRCLGPRRVAFDRAGVGCGIGRRGSAVGGGLARRPGRGRCLRSRGQAPGGAWLWAAPARGPRGADALCGPLGSGRRRRAHIPHRRRDGTPSTRSGWCSRAATVTQTATQAPPPPQPSASHIAGSGGLRNAEQRAAGAFRTRLPFELGSRVDVDSHRSDCRGAARGAGIRARCRGRAQRERGRCAPGRAAKDIAIGPPAAHGATLPRRRARPLTRAPRLLPRSPEFQWTRQPRHEAGQAFGVPEISLPILGATDGGLQFAMQSLRLATELGRSVRSSTDVGLA